MSVLQDRGVPIALVTDGRMSGASGKTPAAIHVTPEALEGGPLAYVLDGDVVRLDAEAGVLAIDADLTTRERARPNSVQSWGYGRELFGAFRNAVSSAERGASVCFVAEPSQKQPEIRDVADPNVQNREIDA
jgi:phosphogluconate dehydratase